MTNQENSANRAVVLYKESPLERIDTRVLAFAETHQKNSRFFIPEDIVVGRYRVAGFLIVDNRPEQRWVSYTDPGFTGIERDESDLPFKENINLSHFLNTNRGFKMIRYFILPPNVAEFFEQDRFLGEPMIDKCCRDGTLPDDFDEEPARPDFAFGSGYHTDGGGGGEK